MELFIREMNPEDSNSIQYIAETSWHTTYDGIIPRKIQDNFLKGAYSEEMLKHRMKVSTILVAEVKKELVGFANFSSVSKEGNVELSAIYLLPDYQGYQIGTALLNEGIMRLPGVKKVFINVERDNEIGKNFYHAKGFKVTSEFDDNFDGHILKTIRMELRIESMRIS